MRLPGQDGGSINKVSGLARVTGLVSAMIVLTITEYFLPALRTGVSVLAVHHRMRIIGNERET